MGKIVSHEIKSFCIHLSFKIGWLFFVHFDKCTGTSTKLNLSNLRLLCTKGSPFSTTRRWQWTASTNNHMSVCHEQQKKWRQAKRLILTTRNKIICLNRFHIQFLYNRSAHLNNKSLPRKYVSENKVYY